MATDAHPISVGPWPCVLVSLLVPGEMVDTREYDGALALVREAARLLGGEYSVTTWGGTEGHTQTGVAGGQDGD